MTHTLKNPIQSNPYNCLYAPEMSRIFSVKALKDAPIKIDIEANDIERDALATRFQILAIEKLKTSLKIHRKNGLILVEGELQAKISQTCSITLDPFKNTVIDQFTIEFDPSIVWDDFCLDEEFFGDTPEPIINNQIDLGELVAQQLFLCIDPYPRSPGACLAEAISRINVKNVKVITAGTMNDGPFAALKELQTPA